MRSRASHKQAQRQRDAAPSPIPPPIHATSAPHTRLMSASAKSGTSAAVTAAAAETAANGPDAMRLALSYGRSALLTHLAHQHDDSSTQLPYAYSAEDWARIMGENASSTTTESAAFGSHSSGKHFFSADDGLAALLTEVEVAWAKLDKDMKLRWIVSTPQGRRALRQAMETAAETRRGGRAPSHLADAAQRVPSLDQMLSKYADALVRPRLPRPAARSPAPKDRHLYELFCDARAQNQLDHVQLFSPQDGEVRMHKSATRDSANRTSLRRKADAARAMEREKVWFQTLANCLGGDNAVKLVNDVKSLQRSREETGEYEMRAAASNGSVGVPGSVPPASPTETTEEASGHEGGSEPTYSTGFLDLCEELGIRSPRRVYVRSRVLQAVDEAAATPKPLTLDEVRELTTKYCAQYDKEVATIAANAEASGSVPAEKAVSDFERYQLELAVDKVQVKLSKFQGDVPLLRSCTSVFNK
ncbi:hypothetical protein ABB37_06945 [Leptomonas pyrrhocoris]|uniref:Uncharacterized protein n=1 Tax=Leptomonas pyrrhocoris TaxID=157538 RepID=A0A0M9FWM1_LEPPY|nr:hypothetical protein ABB37_06945 [Leptomonas pyrrhocoris]XP_015656014.1 hypothetical protein ABB37_06945 [Leptomonas pyrrhocoris]KPA77574.1 hypothetical protein ABB37_06945 [Leptomonas pyrrhocoris]KPA77575.1 hypothetical protein ABB37_06945 [Leptomonas pyrrhocoris]|eukprot:XP_015656013.1 hypothetical protein ABB37_06945 [Leptomonas pyrrhocoris]